MDSWKRNHASAIEAAGTRGLTTPDNDKAKMEHAIVCAVQSLRLFAEGRRALYSSEIGHDYVLGVHWATMARSVIGMLNGEAGRLDCGTVERSILDMAEDFGVDL